MGQRLFAPNHGLSQLITSFIACKSLGIHRTPFVTFMPLLIPKKETSMNILEVVLV